MTKVRIIIQCRTNSSRLPAKAFLPFNGIPAVVLCAKRAMNQGVDAVVATSTSPYDDALSLLLTQNNIPFIRGPLKDVLKRFVIASEDLNEKDLIVRLTADNLFPDGNFINEVIEYTLKNKLDYCSTDARSNGLPYGSSAEVFTVKALRTADKNATSEYEREHVTPWLRTHMPQAVYLFQNSLQATDLRSTLDTLDDYVNLQKVFANIEDPFTVSWRQLCEILFRNSHTTEFTLGTVQLGVSYGVTNIQGLPSEQAATSLINAALKSGVKTFDCARGYGLAESRLGKTLAQNQSVTIITKLAPFEQNQSISYQQQVKESVAQSCLELKREKLDVLMFHRFWHFQTPEIYNTVLEMKQKGLIGQLGISVNSVEECILALQDHNIENIQLPFNILDWRWRSQPFLELINERSNVTIFARSVFLQGLILSPLSLWPEKFKEIGQDVIKRLNAIVKDFARTNIQDLCINYARAQPWIDSLVIGCVDKQQLEENLTLFQQPVLTNVQCLEIQNQLPKFPETFLSPVLW